MRSNVVTRFAAPALFAFAAAGATTPALAQLSPAQALLDQSFVFNLGGFVMQTDVKGSLNGQSTENPEVDFDQAFGKANDASRVRADALWRITPKHHLTFMYFDNSNTRTKTLGEDVHWGDSVLQQGTTASIYFNEKVAALSYEYAFMRQPNYEVSASFGLHVSDLKLKLTGDAIVNGVPESGHVEANTVTIPLPVIGIRGAWAVTPNLVLDAQGQFFHVNANGVGGSWSDLRANATWMFNKNFGLGLGYDRFYNHLDVSKSGFDGRLKMGYSGLQVYGTVAF